MNKGHRPAAERTDYSNAEIARYYRDTRWQYRGLWTGKHSLALHYGYWDETTDNLTEALSRMDEVLANRASISSDDFILDAGCGWGGSTIWLFQNRGSEALGVNIEGEQVAKCWEKAEDARVARWVNFMRADYHSTPLKGGLFDVVWAIESVCHSKEKAEFFKEAYRLLKPGGRLVIADFFRADTDLTSEQEEALRNWLDQWVVPGLATFGEFKEIARTTGFGEIELEDVTENIKHSALLLNKKGRMLTPLALMFRFLRLPFYTDMSHANWRSSMLQYRALEAGAWRYGHFLAKKE